LKVLADLERDDPKFAFPAARLVGLYRRLWESCVPKHIDGEKLEPEMARSPWCVLFLLPAAKERTAMVSRSV
jgi:hypothetical protein